MKYTTGMCPKHFKRRNGRLIRRGQMDKQSLRYYRASRKPVMVHSIISELLPVQRHFQEYMDLISDHMTCASTLPESWKMTQDNSTALMLLRRNWK